MEKSDPKAASQDQLPPAASVSRPSAHANSFVAVADSAFRESPLVALKLFKASAPRETFDHCHIIPREGARPVIRQAMTDKARINYRSFNPPSLWAAPYSVLLADFEPVEPGDSWLQHPGEEVLVPMRGAVQYQYLWWPEGRLTRQEMAAPVRPGEILRVNPQIPHHTWASGGENATAFMVMRDAGNSPSSISLAPPDRSNLRHAYMTDFAPLKLADFASTTEFALRAWDLGRALARQRNAAGLSLAQVAGACGIDKAQLSRFETADHRANLTMDALIRVARHLRVGLIDLVENCDWFDIPKALSHHPGDSRVEPTGLRPPGFHLLHFRSLSLQAGSERYIVPPCPDVPWSSWIVLEGTVLLEWESDESARLEVVNQGGVAHFRGSPPTHAEPRGKTEILEVTYSTLCRCGGESSNRNPLSPRYYARPEQST